MDDRELERALTLGLIFMHDGNPYWALDGALASAHVAERLRPDDKRPRRAVPYGAQLADEEAQLARSVEDLLWRDFPCVSRRGTRCVVERAFLTVNEANRVCWTCLSVGKVDVPLVLDGRSTWPGVEFQPGQSVTAAVTEYARFIGPRDEGPSTPSTDASDPIVRVKRVLVYEGRLSVIQKTLNNKNAGVPRDGMAQPGCDIVISSTTFEPALVAGDEGLRADLDTKARLLGLELVPARSRAGSK